MYTKTKDFWKLCAKKPPKEFCKGGSERPLVCVKDGKAKFYGLIVDTSVGKQIDSLVIHFFDVLCPLFFYF